MAGYIYPTELLYNYMSTGYFMLITTQQVC